MSEAGWSVSYVVLYFYALPSVIGLGPKFRGIMNCFFMWHKLFFLFLCHEFLAPDRYSSPMTPFLQLPPLDSFGAYEIYLRCPSYWDRVWKPIGVDGQPSKCDICGEVKFQPLCTNYNCPDCHLPQSHIPNTFSRMLVSGRMTPEEETLSRFFCVRVTSPGLWHFTGRLEAERNTTLVNRTL